MPRKSVRAHRRKPGFYYIAFLSLGCIAAALMIALFISSCFKKIEVRAGVIPPAQIADAGDTEDSMVINRGSFFDEEPEPEVTEAPETVDLETAEQSLLPVVKREGYLPVFTKANTNEPIIAITVDECNTVDIIKQFCDAALLRHAKLTLFPAGEYLDTPGMEQIFPAIVHEYGFEVENRGQNVMGRVYRMDDETLLNEIWEQNCGVNLALNEKYTMHFFRPFGANGIEDAHLQYILKQLGYYGTVGWTTLGSSLTKSNLEELVTPGSIFFFKSLPSELEKMEMLMDYAQKNGIGMVTLNELFGFEENACAPDDDLLFGQKTPEISPYVPVLRIVAEGESSYDVYRMQKRLAELGYTDETADGVFGSGTSNALRLFQSACGKAATGIADIDTQERLYQDDAPVRGAEVLYR